jgi:hypothetical protein
MLDTTVAQPEVAPTETVTTESGTQNQTPTDDPFAVDESQFVSLSPEQRAALDPVMSKWKESANSYAQRARDEEGKKYQQHVKESEALRKLTADPRFIKWYNETNNPQTGNVAPRSVASAEEWSQAYQSLAAGDPLPFEQLQAKLVMSVGGPQLQRTQQEMSMLRAENEMNKLWAAHPDAKDLDVIGREEDPEAPSLLQIAAQSTMQGGMVDWNRAYALAKKVSLSMENKGKRAAMGMVTEKKGSVTEKPSTNSREEGVQYVDTMEEAMTANIEAAMDGRKVKYQVKK